MKISEDLPNYQRLLWYCKNRTDFHQIYFAVVKHSNQLWGALDANQFSMSRDLQYTVVKEILEDSNLLNLLQFLFTNLAAESFLTSDSNLSEVKDICQQVLDFVNTQYCYKDDWRSVAKGDMFCKLLFNLSKALENIRNEVEEILFATVSIS